MKSIRKDSKQLEARFVRETDVEFELLLTDNWNENCANLNITESEQMEIMAFETDEKQ